MTAGYNSLVLPLPESGARPLYLPAGRDLCVSLDGRALRITGTARSTVRHPLLRLSRVISDRGVQWDSLALVACLELGIPVTFHDAGGKILGTCFGRTRRESSLSGMLRTAVDDIDWSQRYLDWEMATSRSRALEAMQRIGCPRPREDGADDAVFRTAFCNAHYRRFGQSMRPLLAKVSTAASAQYAVWLADAVPDLSLLGWPREGFSLFESVQRILAWDIHALVHSLPKDAPISRNPEFLAAELVEQSGPYLARCFGQVLGGLEHWLRSWAQ